jgi:hypothetical protein
MRLKQLGVDDLHEVGLFAVQLSVGGIYNK